MAAHGDPLAGLVACFVAAAVVLGIAVLIRIRGPIGLVNGVDWRRVSDVHGLGEFVSLMLLGIGAVVAANGVALYAFRFDSILLGSTVIVFLATLALLTAAMLIGLRRFQDKPAQRKADGRR